MHSYLHSCTLHLLLHLYDHINPDMVSAPSFEFPPKLKHMRHTWDCSEKLKQLEEMNYNRNTSYLMLNIWYSVFKNLLIVYLAQQISLNFLLPPIPNPSLLGMSMGNIVSSVFSPPTSPSQSNSLLLQFSFQDIYLKMTIFVPKNILFLTVVLHFLVLVTHIHFSVPMRYEKKGFVLAPCFVLKSMVAISPFPFILPALLLTAVVTISFRHHK